MHVPLVCDPAQLSVAKYQLSAGKPCAPSLMSLDIRGGYVCYDGTVVGSSAVYFCLCGHNSARQSSTRRCTSNGIWNGSTPLCDCKPLNLCTCTPTNIFIHKGDSSATNTTPTGLYAGMAITVAVIISLSIALVTVIMTKYCSKTRNETSEDVSRETSKAEAPIYEEIVVVPSKMELSIAMDENDAYSHTTLSAYRI